MKIARLIAWVALSLTLIAGMAHAVQPDEIMRDPAQEARARALSREIRCMVCQNQSIDDSDAPLARDLRILVRERIAAGDSDAKVLDYLVERYGQFVLLKPSFDSSTLILWLFPPLVLLIGIAAAFFGWRRHQGGTTRGAGAALSPEEMARVEALPARHEDGADESRPGEGS